MKICTANSSRGPHCQIMRIEDGFRALGHEIVSDMRDADLIYQNNFWFDNILAAKKRGEIKAKIILNVLDVPEHIIDQFDLDKAMRQLKQADAVTSISEFVYYQVEKFFNIKSNIIYQPIMDLDEIYPHPVGGCLSKSFLHIGRRTDPNKRFYLVPLIFKEFTAFHQLYTIGGEQVPEICREHIHVGDVQPDILAAYYRNASYSFSFGKYEGLNLPVIEAMKFGCIPLVASDLTTRQELLPSEIFPEYNQFYSIPNIVNFINDLEGDPYGKKLEFSNRIKNHYETKLKDKFNKISVAKKILDVYNRL